MRLRLVSERCNQARAEAWTDETFKQVYGMTLDQFETVQ
jgi:hypothetical protein